jgi:hypothetical protein
MVIFTGKDANGRTLLRLGEGVESRIDAMEKKITPSDLRAEAQRLIEAGQMPSRETLLKAVAETRAKYVPLILVAISPSSKYMGRISERLLLATRIEYKSAKRSLQSEIRWAWN